MKQDDKLYNEWLDEVRNVQPILSNPDELTTAILQQVSRIVPHQNGNIDCRMGQPKKYCWAE